MSKKPWPLAFMSNRWLNGMKLFWGVLFISGVPDFDCANLIFADNGIA